MTTPDNLAPFAPKGEAPSVRDALRAADVLAEWHSSLYPDGWRSRCDWCGWPLEDDPNKGCVRGNCSQRPRPQHNDSTGREKLRAYLEARAALSAPPPPEPARFADGRARAYLQDMAERGCEGGWKNDLICRDVHEEDGEQIELGEYCDPCRAQSILLNERGAAAPPPEPVVRWCAKRFDGGLHHDTWPTLAAAEAALAMLGGAYVGGSVVRVEIREAPE